MKTFFNESPSLCLPGTGEAGGINLDVWRVK